MERVICAAEFHMMEDRVSMLPMMEKRLEDLKVSLKTKEFAVMPNGKINAAFWRLLFCSITIPLNDTRLTGGAYRKIKNLRKSVRILSREIYKLKKLEKTMDRYAQVGEKFVLSTGN
ncbi:MAG: hypothetical protein PHT44_03550 [Candidatus Portnoybacteria bacterium]|nr:hypothetical protein [Candidatus Portnoybacteria bacterium]MDD4983097.1 hypothetical protein [Candidatus Portnoybacteria bacterium]